MGPLTAPRRAHGFTLVEILVVLAIVALAAGAAALAFDRDERSVVERESRRFAGAVEYAATRAQMRGEWLGVSADDTGWRFWIRGRDADWQPLAGDDALQPRALQPPVTARAMSFAGRAIAPDAIVPLRPSGRNEPFVFALSGAAFAATLASDPLNRVTIAGPAAVAP